VRWHAADLLDPGRRRAVVERARPTPQLHLAWEATPGAFWTAPENASWVAATVGLMEDFAAAGGERAVFAGTCAEYDWSAPQPLREDGPLQPCTLYGACKDATRRVVAALGERHGIAVVWGRVFFLYGPGEDERRLVADVASRLVAGERAATSAGDQVRDFQHVDDVAAGFAALAAAGATGAVNVASGAGVAVRRVVELIAAAAGRPDLLDAGALAPRADDPPSIVADVTRLREEVGFVPSIALEDGLAATVDWWRARVARR
jgi:nucleoside-diphosphate-sugar epimerase